MKWPYSQRVSSGTALAVIGIGAGALIGLMGVFASFQGARLGYCWWWPTGWMAAPAVVMALGLVVLVVPVQRSTSSGRTPPVHGGVGRELEGASRSVVHAAHVGEVHVHQAPAGDVAARAGFPAQGGTQGAQRYRAGQGAPEWEGLFEQALRELGGRVVQDVHGQDRVLSGLEASAEVMWFGRRVVQRFACSVSEVGLVLIGGPERTVVAVAGEVWERLLDLGGEAVDGDALTALGRPLQETATVVYVGARAPEVELVGGTWGPGRLVRPGLGEAWCWEPYNSKPETVMIREKDYWTYDVGQRLRMRLVAAQHWADARHLEITTEHRVAVERVLAGSTVVGLFEDLSERRGAKIAMPAWMAVSRTLSNTSDRLAYSCEVTGPGGDLVLSVEIMMSLPDSLTGVCVTCVQASVHDLDAWRSLLIEHGATTVEADLRLTPADLAEFFARASRDAARLLPSALGESLPPRYVSAPKLQLVIATDRSHHDRPYPPLRTYVDLAPLGPSGDQDIPSLAVSVTSTPAADLAVGGRVTRTALETAAGRFGFIDATDQSFLPRAT